jgi:GST-like protein
MAIFPWAKLWERQGQDIEQFPNVRRWLDANLARPAVQRGLAVNAADRAATNMDDPAVRAVLFGQRHGSRGGA